MEKGKKSTEMRRLMLAILVIAVLAGLYRAGQRLLSDQKNQYYNAIAENIDPPQDFENDVEQVQEVLVASNSQSSESFTTGPEEFTISSVGEFPENIEEIGGSTASELHSQGSGSGSSQYVRSSGGVPVALLGTGGMWPESDSSNYFVSDGFTATDSASNDSGDGESGEPGDGIDTDPGSVVHHTPAPGAIILGSAGIMIVGFLRRRGTL